MGMKAVHVPEAGGRTLRALGTSLLVKLTAAETGGMCEAIVVTCGRGGDAVPHRHPWAELYFVLDGTLQVRVGGRSHSADAGDVVTIPARALHGFEVISDSASFLHLSFGEGASAMFEDFAAAVPGEPVLEDLATILDINQRHGVELQLPAEILEAQD